jgi:hypothetical protein
VVKIPKGRFKRARSLALVIGSNGDVDTNKDRKHGCCMLEGAVARKG